MDNKYIPHKDVKLKVTEDIMLFLNSHNVWHSYGERYFEVRQVYKHDEAEPNVIIPVDKNPYDRPVDAVMIELQFKWKRNPERSGECSDAAGMPIAIFNKRKGYQLFELAYNRGNQSVNIFLMVSEEPLPVYMGNLPTEQQFIHLENLLGLAGDSTGPDADQASAGEGVPQPQ